MSDPVKTNLHEMEKNEKTGEILAYFYVRESLINLGNMYNAISIVCL